MNKILAICTSPDKGGLELYFAKLVNYFYSQNKQVWAICRENSAIESSLNIQPLTIKKVSVLNIFIQALSICKIINKNNINIIHIGWGKDLLLAVLVKIFSKKSLKLIYYRQMKITRSKKDFYHKYIYSYIDLLLVITEKLKDEALYFTTMHKDQVQKLLYGVESPEIETKDTRNKFLRELGLNEKIYTIGVFSRIEEQKGQHLVIEAMNLLGDTPLQLVIVGHSMDDSYKAKLKTLIEDYNFESKVKFIPFIDKPMRVMPFFDVIILPTYEETFGLVVVESMMMSVPVIGSNAGGVPEIINDNDNGLLFSTKDFNSLRDKILLLMNSKDLRVKLSNNGKLYANKHYNYDKHFELLEKYMGIVNE